ncbi:hypothetical protein G6L26_008650 [Agrobacterium radiobacter]|uniref:Uncharacterized protein n=1 Tax=Agrobacterium tumefaciens str. B6 TaxID=1183423 RepID=A0A822UYX5_AGRTU|nr:hypothetical protein [Agrobacterium tumefaciens]KWT87917.1 hypothetical protein ASB65_19655 [Agrobacterium tumefaciens str. B6]MQB28401.1 hypothetical protein [Agrobacterium tumefaciens]NTA05254.1 hypothetical protein [Agrobacterium tumefaciens]NTB12999.1 hypothetical protein [Agrobacterium tumefaciens]OCJ37183.1 hypothetical protein A6U90_24610 [Agrobacterium tumefaciens]
MAVKTTLIPGLTFNLMIEEVNERAPCGSLLCYVASIYRVEKATSVRRLIGKSRLPGAADDMKQEIQRNGIQAFRRFSRT